MQKFLHEIFSIKHNFCTQNNYFSNLDNRKELMFEEDNQKINIMKKLDKRPIVKHG